MTRSLLDIADREEARSQANRDAAEVRCTTCETVLADRYDIAPNSGIEVYNRPFCDWPCAHQWAAEKYHTMWANGEVPEDYR